MLLRQDRRGLSLQRREIVHVIVERLERPVPRVAQDLIEPAALGFAGEQGDTQGLGFAQLGRQFGQHGDAPGHVEPPMHTGSPAARNGRARSTARGNWLDCTPISPIKALPPLLRSIRMIRSGRTLRLVSS